MIKCITCSSILLVGMMVASSLFGEETLPPLKNDKAPQKESSEQLLNLFPESSAPTFYEKKSKLVLKKELDWKTRDSRWGARGDEWRGLSIVDEATRKEQKAEIDESNVFHARLQHQSLEERKWDLGIGKGGHIYSIYSSFGEAIPPQTSHAQWMDEAWQFTTIYPSVRRMKELPKEYKGKGYAHFGNAFVHQSGMYIKGDMERKTFYTPMLAEHFDSADRSYALLNWGQIPTPSINRSGVLIYVKYRDLGDGVFEVTYLIYNFEDETMTNLGPWGGVRHSVFPEQVVSNPDGSYRYFHPVSFFGGTGRIRFRETGGWIAATQNADNPYSYALGVVFGTDLDKNGKPGRNPTYSCGYAEDAMRDYMVQATSIGGEEFPRTPHLLRMYFVIGTLEKVARKANLLSEHAEYRPLDFNASNVPLVPLYAATLGDDKIVTRNVSGNPVCHIYAWPVNGSYPLFLIKNNNTNRYFVTTDPYAQCARESFENPFEPGHKYHANFENRTLYHTYRKQTEWVGLLGFVLPKDKVESGDHNYTSLSTIPEAVASFDAGEKLDANNLMVRAK